jgi:hypothetical protein
MGSWEIMGLGSGIIWAFGTVIINLAMLIQQTAAALRTLLGRIKRFLKAGLWMDGILARLVTLTTYAGGYAALIEKNAMMGSV